MKLKSVLAFMFAIFGILFYGIPQIPSFNSNETHARIFCAYGKVFVEFHEKNNIWGVLMLDDAGAPIPCYDDEVMDKKAHGNTNYKGMI